MSNQASPLFLRESWKCLHRTLPPPSSILTSCWPKAITCTVPEPNHFIRHVILHPKKDGGHWLILNLTSFNKQIHKIKFKMETLDHILALITPGCFMTKIDLADAFLTIPVAPKFQKFLKFPWQGQLYQYACLLFGFTSSHQLFTKVLKPLIAHLHEHGHTVMFYLNAGWQSSATYDCCHMLFNTLPMTQFWSMGSSAH